MRGVCTETEFLTSISIAHRGLHNNVTVEYAPGIVPENSLGAFQNGLAEGFALEMDVALSRDGQVMVFHDDTLARLCASAVALADADAAFLTQQALLKTGEKIPTLSQVLALVQGRVPLIIELKSFESRTGFHTDGNLERACVRVLSEYSGAHAYKSFNPHSVEELLTAKVHGLTQAPIGFLACDYSRDEDFAKLPRAEWSRHQALTSPIAERADFISYGIDDLTDEIAARAHDRGQPLMVWTVRTKTQYDKARRLGANVVFEWRGVPRPAMARISK